MSKEIAEVQVIAAQNTITLSLPNPFHLEFFLENSGNGASSPRVVHAANVTLSKGTLYKLPIKESALDYNNFHAIKVASGFRNKIDVLDVADGYAVVRPIIHGTILNDNDMIAELL